MKFQCSKTKLYHYNFHTATRDGAKSEEIISQFKELRNVACGILAVWAVTAVSPVIAASPVSLQQPFLFYYLFSIYFSDA